MKIVISPAKSLDYETPIPTKKYTEPVFLESAQKLNKVLANPKHCLVLCLFQIN